MDKKQKKNKNGIGKRVTIGFLSIVALLFFSGMISLIELSRVSGQPEAILTANQHNIEIVEEMLDAARDQNMSIIRLSIFGDRTGDSICRVSMARLEAVLEIAREEARDKAQLDSLTFMVTDMRILTDNYLDFGLNDEGDYIDPDWYADHFEPMYDNLTTAIENYMDAAQRALMPHTERLKRDAYRAVTPVLISLAVMIAVVLMFYYFVTIYGVFPIVRINRALGDYLNYRMPFNVKAECRDELAELRERIETLIARAKTGKN